MTFQTGAFVNTRVISQPITVNDVATATPISVTGGLYSVNGGPYSASPGTVNNGDTVSVLVMTADRTNSQNCVTLTIGGVSGLFCVTTGSIPVDAGQIFQLLDSD